MCHYLLMTILVVAQTSSVITRTHERKHGTKDITISVSWDLGLGSKH
jgi:hypothetical protein